MKHRRRLSGPLLDRIDLLVKLESEGTAGLGSEPLTSSAKAREQVTLARERQAARLREEGVTVNAQMDVPMLQRHARLDPQAEELLIKSQRARPAERAWPAPGAARGAHGRRPQRQRAGARAGRRLGAGDALQHTARGSRAA